MKSTEQYFEIKIEYMEITPKEFEENFIGFEEKLEQLFEGSERLEKEIKRNFKSLRFKDKARN